MMGEKNEKMPKGTMTEALDMEAVADRAIANARRRGMVIRDGDTEDLRQDVLLRLVEKVPQMPSLAYAQRVAWNCLLDSVQDMSNYYEQELPAANFINWPDESGDPAAIVEAYEDAALETDMAIHDLQGELKAETNPRQQMNLRVRREQFKGKKAELREAFKDEVGRYPL